MATKRAEQIERESAEDRDESVTAEGDAGRVGGAEKATAADAGDPSPGTEIVTYDAEAGAGMEDVGADEMLIPFFRILQPLSPQLDENSGSYSPDAKAGMIVNTATGELYSGKEGIGFVVVLRDHNYIEFVPRSAGGGFVGVWSPTDARLKELKNAQGSFGKLTLANGNELTETYYMYGLAFPLKDGKPAPEEWSVTGVIGFASTQIKVYKTVIMRFQSLLGQPKPRFPTFAFAWVVKTIGMKNRKGSFHGWAFNLLGGTPATALMKAADPLVQQARGFHLLLKEGRAKADYAASRVSETGDGTDDRADGTEEEIPF